MLVGTTIFSNKAKNYADLTYLTYFKDLDWVDSYAWGTAALTFLYEKLSNATVLSCTYVAGYLTCYR
ncbi:serine/threonine-protein phosphatase 7 long form-like protein [Trifolium medium]|uniref:Serine/threonine-protein phosphatase 7 long form-like protein n=1 Tax=Trifolium medium TaxID=97028 RepID=A0A392UCT6_9FABA|nr:serine/threonine-protein phosphatase 7 long form-like protein [Trifolium medium]